MTFESALALFAVMPSERQERVTRVFDLLRPQLSVKEAFREAVTDEFYAIELEMHFASEPTVMQ